MINKITIYGERCSGTNYLEHLITQNFEQKITWAYGWKHFFGHSNLNNSDNILFIGLIRNPYDWLNSLYLNQYHLPIHFKDLKNFLNSEIYSLNNLNNEILADRNIYTKERYKNIFELRNIKNKFLIEDMPKLVKNYILFTYEMFISDFENTMTKLKNCGLTIKQNINFPVNIYYDAINNKKKYQNNKKKIISNTQITNNLNIFYERDILGYEML
jgi:hypothetical protein